MYTIPIKEVNLKKFVDFSSVFSKPKEGSQVDLGQKYADNILELLNQRKMLPISANKFIQLVHCAIQDKGININFLFLKKIIISYFKNRRNVELKTEGMNLTVNLKEEIEDVTEHDN